ncbi:MAG TPA: hypothetical protein VGN55_08500 [Xanthobacteraceae bacterium]|jgi:hypothetical protein
MGKRNGGRFIQQGSDWPAEDTAGTRGIGLAPRRACADGEPRTLFFERFTIDDDPMLRDILDEERLFVRMRKVGQYWFEAPRAI